MKSWQARRRLVGSIALAVLAVPAVAQQADITLSDATHRYHYSAREVGDGIDGTLTITRTRDRKVVGTLTHLPPPGCDATAATDIPMNALFRQKRRSFAVFCGSDTGRSNVLLVLSRGRLVAKLDFAEQSPNLSWSRRTGRFTAAVYRRVLQRAGNLFPILTIDELDPRGSAFRPSFAPRHASRYLDFYRQLEKTFATSDSVPQSLVAALVSTGDTRLICREIATSPLLRARGLAAIDADAAFVTRYGIPPFSTRQCQHGGK